MHPEIRILSSIQRQNRWKKWEPKEIDKVTWSNRRPGPIDQTPGLLCKISLVLEPFEARSISDGLQHVAFLLMLRKILSKIKSLPTFPADLWKTPDKLNRNQEEQILHKIELSTCFHHSINFSQSSSQIPYSLASSLVFSWYLHQLKHKVSQGFLDIWTMDSMAWNNLHCVQCTVLTLGWKGTQRQFTFTSGRVVSPDPLGLSLVQYNYNWNYDNNDKL